MKHTSKFLSILLTVCLIVGLVPWTATPARAADAVPYVYYTADGGALTKHDGSVTDYTPVTGQTVAWSAGWYVAAGAVTVDERVTVTGDVRLILCDGATLTAGKGVTVSGEGNSLTVYAQSSGNDMGALTATGNGYDAGIGGAEGEGDNGAGGAGGTVTVHGGAVTATGGSSDRAGAGIGGGAGRGSGAGGAGGTVTVYGGTVTATGGSNDQDRGGAGVGGGGSYGYAGGGGTVAVYGGTVTATGGDGGAGIGSGGFNGGADGGALTVYGGAVIATGGEGGAGIGGGWGIGGGTVTINDGTVTATGGTYGAGIGGGNWGAGGAVEINGGTVTASGNGITAQNTGMGIGRGHNSENNGSLTIGEGVKLLTSADNSSWTDTTGTPGTRRQYMKTLSRAVACVTSGGATTNYETLTAALAAWTDGTTLKLLADVETDSTITVAENTSVTLDLNDHGILAKAYYAENGSGNTFRVIKVSDGAALTLEDTAASGTRRYITLGKLFENGNKVHGTAVSAVTPEGEVGTDYLAVKGGYITGGLPYDSSNSSNCDGGGVYVDGVGTFTMTGGTIAGNAALTGDGGGVYVNYKYENGRYVGGTFTMTGGTIAGNTAWDSGGGVYLGQNATFTMTGGTIAGNKASDHSGGGVYIQYSEFTMTGGKIAGNTASSGGGVFADGSQAYPCSFTMSGGAEISGNKASSSGGVCANSYSTFTMSGNARISGNTASGSGGGVYVSSNSTFIMSGNAEISRNEAQNTGYGGGVHVTDSSFTMNGGTVAGNTAYIGGGVYHYSGTFTMNGGTITGNNAASQGGGVGIARGDGRTFNVSGAPVISGNKLGGTFENGSLTGGTANNVHLYDSMTVTVTGALTTGASIGVTMEKPGVFTSDLAKGGTSALACFVSDDKGYAVGLNAQGEAALAAPVTVTFDANGGTGTMAAQELPSGLAAALSANSFTRAGYTFTGWNTEQTPTEQIPGTAYADKASVTLTADLTLYAQWTRIPATAPTIDTQPQDLSLTYGNTQGYLTVEASAAEGHTLSYQWYSNTSASSEGGTAIDGATDASYAVLGGTSAGSYYYYCVVTATRGDNSQAATAVSNVATVTVAPKSLTAAMISDIAAQTYTGNTLTPTVTVRDGSAELTDSDYTVAYSSNTDPGTATVTVTGKGNYTGTATATFQIYGVKGAWADGSLTATAHVAEPANALLIAAVYDGSGKQVSVKIIALEAGKTSYETGVTAKTGGYTYKLMVVSKSSYAPLCAAWSDKA